MGADRNKKIKGGLNMKRITMGTGVGREDLVVGGVSVTPYGEKVMEDIMKKIVSVKGVVKPVNRCEKCGEIIDNKIEGLEGNRHEDRDGEYWLCWVCKKIDEDLINR